MTRVAKTKTATRTKAKNAIRKTSTTRKKTIRLSEKTRSKRRNTSAPRDGVEVITGSAVKIANLQAGLRRVRARYDAAQTTQENSKLWANADGLSALAANSRDVRRTLRQRSRYEVANNSYAIGIAQTLANDTIGTGPRLQIRTDNDDIDAMLEMRWQEWVEDIGLESKLWTMRFAKFEDGEAFALMMTNNASRNKVKLDLRLVEADQISTPTFELEDPKAVDGIRFDDFGNPSEYHILRSHPGDPYYSGSTYDFDKVAAANVLHYFRTSRPGQKRGIPEVTSAIPLFAQLRRYTLAVIAAAEVAADFSLVIQSTGGANAAPPQALDAMDTVALERRMATILPEGWVLGQAKPEQPTTTYGEFKRQIITEIARSLNVPYNIAAGDSSSYNYASGRLDHQMYFKALEVERALIRRFILEPLFRAWFEEAVRITGLLPQPLRQIGVKMRREWLWDGDEHVDPLKEATAEEIQLRSRTKSYAEVYGQRGRDWQTEMKQLAKEQELMKKLGLAVVASPAKTTDPVSKEQDDG